MKQIIILFSSIFLGSYVFATPESPFLSKILATAWKNQQSLHVQLDKNDIAMVYGGKDISSKPIIKHSIKV